MLETTGRLFLAFSHDNILIPLIILGYIWLDRDIYFHAVCLLLTSMLFNLALQSTFKIPLAFSVGKQGFAFPSGHMQSAVVFYGWLFQSTNRLIIKSSITILLIGIGLSLLYFGYHNSFDILGAIFFGLLLIWAYNQLLISIQQTLLPVVILLFNTLLVLYISFAHGMNQYSWMAYYALIGIIFSELHFKQKTTLVDNISKLLATLLCVIAFILTNQIFPKNHFIPFIASFKWLFIGYSAPFSLYCASMLELKRRKV